MHFIFYCKRTRSFSGFSYCQNVFFAQFGGFIFRPPFSLELMSVFKLSIIHIILMGALKQMRRINTTWIVTMVTNEQSSNYFASVQSIRKSMRRILNFFTIKGAIFSSFVPPFCALPYPAGFSFFNAAEKFKCGFFIHVLLLSIHEKQVKKGCT